MISSAFSPILSDLERYNEYHSTLSELLEYLGVSCYKVTQFADNVLRFESRIQQRIRYMGPLEVDTIRECLDYHSTMSKPLYHILIESNRAAGRPISEENTQKLVSKLCMYAIAEKIKNIRNRDELYKIMRCTGCHMAIIGETYDPSRECQQCRQLVKNQKDCDAGHLPEPIHDLPIQLSYMASLTCLADMIRFSDGSRTNEMNTRCMELLVKHAAPGSRRMMHSGPVIADAKKSNSRQLLFRNMVFIPGVEFGEDLLPRIIGHVDLQILLYVASKRGLDAKSSATGVDLQSAHDNIRAAKKFIVQIYQRQLSRNSIISTNISPNGLEEFRSGGDRVCMISSGWMVNVGDNGLPATAALRYSVSCEYKTRLTVAALEYLDFRFICLKFAESTRTRQITSDPANPVVIGLVEAIKSLYAILEFVAGSGYDVINVAFLTMAGIEYLCRISLAAEYLLAKKSNPSVLSAVKMLPAEFRRMLESREADLRPLAFSHITNTITRLMYAI